VAIGGHRGKYAEPAVLAPVGAVIAAYDGLPILRNPPDIEAYAAVGTRPVDRGESALQAGDDESLTQQLDSERTLATVLVQSRCVQLRDGCHCVVVGAPRLHVC
jgi:hypothetical protein